MLCRDEGRPKMGATLLTGGLACQKAGYRRISVWYVLECVGCHAVRLVDPAMVRRNPNTSANSFM
jgi:hypothetical protein